MTYSQLFPKTGTFIISAILTAFSTIIETSSCGEVTTIIPSTGERLEYRKAEHLRFRRHINEHIVNIIPDNICPELLNSARNYRTAPDHRICFIFKQEVYRHDPGAELTFCRVERLIIGYCFIALFRMLWGLTDRLYPRPVLLRYIRAAA